MESSYSHLPNTSESPFAFFQPDGKLDLHQNRIPHHQVNGTELIYQSHIPQQLHQIHMFSPSDISSATLSLSQMYHNGYSGSSQIASPSSVYKKSSLMSSNVPTNLLVKSSIHDSDVFYYPSTPPLSASPSVSGSPSEYTGLPTPVNAAFFNIHQVKDDVMPERGRTNLWNHFASPPVTPAFAQPNSLTSNTNSNDVLSMSCPSLSPSDSSISNQLSPASDHDFCDPRKLTVHPANQSNLASDKPMLLNNLNPICPSAESHKYQEFETLSDSRFPGYNILHRDVPNFSQITGLGTNEDFYNMLEFPCNEQQVYFNAKRHRSESGLPLFLTSPEQNECPESDQCKELNIACPLSPASSSFDQERKGGKRLRKLRKISSLTTMFNVDSMESLKPDVKLKTEGGNSSGSDGPNNTNHKSCHSGVSENKSTDVSKPQTQVTRRGRKQSETEDLSKTFVCDSCSRRFKRQEHLKRHYRSVHTQEKPFKCPECGKDFSRSDNLAQHSRTHGNSPVVMGLLNGGEMENDTDADCEHIGNLSSVLYNVAAATPGSETDHSSQCSSRSSNSVKDGQSRKKRRRPE